MKTRKVLLILSLLISADAFSQDWQWENHAGWTYTDEGKDIVTDLSGNEYIAGDFYAKAVMDTATTVYGNGKADALISAYDQNGNFLWADHGGGIQYDKATAIARFGAELYVTGYFAGVSARFGYNTVTLSGVGNSDIFLAKYDIYGNFHWAVKIGGSGDEISADMVISSSGDIFITGYFRGTAAFGTMTFTSAGGYDAFIMKLDHNGNVLWAKQGGGINDDEGNGVTLDGNGNAYVAGYFNGGTYAGSATFGSTTFSSFGQMDIFLLKYDTNGNMLWAKQAGGDNYDVASGIYADYSGDIFITGYFSQTADFGGHIVSTAGFRDMFVAHYDSNGNCAWASQAGNVSGHDEGRAVVADAFGNIYVCGYFTGTASFGISTLSSFGGNDIVIAKFDGSGNCLWGKSGGGGGADVGLGLALDANDNVRITGYFSNLPAVFDADTIPNSGLWDLFVAALSNPLIGIPDSDPAKTAVEIYPNPFSEEATIVFAGNDACYFFLYDMNGREIEEIEIESGDKLKRNTMPVGVYIYELIDREGRLIASGKVIIE